MLPRLSIPYPIDHRYANTELISDGLVAHFAAKLSYLRHLIGSQLRKVSILSDMEWRLRLSKELNGMAVVLAASDYFEIFCFGIMPYSVFMVHFHAFRDWTNKSGGDEPMNSMDAALPIYLSKAHARIARIIAGSFHDPLSRTAHSAQIADGISWISLYRPPYFVKILFRHLGCISQSRCLEPVAALERCIGSLLFYQHDSMAATGECRA